MMDKEYTKELANKIEQATNYDVKVSFSKTNFGESHYIIVKKNADDNFEAKIRISDHSVSNFGRMFNEIHLFFKNIKEENMNNVVDFLVAEIRWKLEKSKYFLSKDVTVKKEAYNVQTENIRVSDVLQSEFKTKKGNTMYIVTRTYDIPSIKWTYKPTNKTFFIEEKKMERGGILNTYFYSIGGL
jgi:hypothetical protein